MSVYPQAGRYVVVETNGFVPWVIRKATHSWADHAFITLEDGGIIEAMPGGVRRSHIEKYAGCRMAVNSAEPYGPETANLVMAKAISLVGVQYNDLDILDLGLESLGIMWKWLAKAAGADGRLICSQAAALCGQAAHMDWLCGRSSVAEVRPSDLANRPVVQPYIL
jgi:hypothetical protein